MRGRGRASRGRGRGSGYHGSRVFSSRVPARGNYIARSNRMSKPAARNVLRRFIRGPVMNKLYRPGGAAYKRAKQSFYGSSYVQRFQSKFKRNKFR